MSFGVEVGMEMNEEETCGKKPQDPVSFSACLTDNLLGNYFEILKLQIKVRKRSRKNE